MNCLHTQLNAQSMPPCDRRRGGFPFTRKSISALGLVALQVILVTATAKATLIDFENLGLADGDLVPTIGGVTFDGHIAVQGGDWYGFGTDQGGYDEGNSAPFNTPGNTFITNPGGWRSPSATKVITIEFSSPVSELSFLVADVDSTPNLAFVDLLTSQVFDAQGTLLGTNVFTAPTTGNFGDGEVASINFGNVTDIAELVVTLSNQPGTTSIGFGVDNLRFAPEPATISLLALGGVAMLTRRLRSRRPLLLPKG